jgi:hypothetical protein
MLYVRNGYVLQYIHIIYNERAEQFLRTNKDFEKGITCVRVLNYSRVCLAIPVYTLETLLFCLLLENLYIPIYHFWPVKLVFQRTA